MSGARAPRGTPHSVGCERTQPVVERIRRVSLLWDTVSTGKAVVVKRMVYTAGETGRRVRAELQVAVTSASSGSDGLLGMLHNWCEHGESPPCCVESGIPQTGVSAATSREEVYYTMPLAISDFDTLTAGEWRELPPVTRLDYFHQTLSGLRKIHAMGIIHGKIRPQALFFVQRPSSEESWKAVLSSAVHLRTYGIPKRTGYWVAPEVWTNSEKECYSAKADIWALAASWLRAILIPPAGISRVSPGIYRNIVRALQERRGRSVLEPLCDLLLSMMAWDPNERPTAEQALRHVAWEPLRRSV